MMKAEEPVEPRNCPYVDLDYYHEKSGAWFYGREADGSMIITNLQAACMARNRWSASCGGLFPRQRDGGGDETWAPARGS